MVATVTISYAQTLTVDEAKAKFDQLACFSCHNGNTAPTWDEMLQMIASWGQQYDNIDEAVRNEVVYFGGQKFDSYDDLMSTMAANVGGKTLDDPDIQDLYNFFLAVFNGEVQIQQAGGQPDTGAGAGAPTAGAGGQEEGRNLFFLTITLAVIAAIVLLLVFSRMGGGE